MNEQEIQAAVSQYLFSEKAITITSPLIPVGSSVMIDDEDLTTIGREIYNNSGNTIYISLGSPASSASNMTFPIAAWSREPVRYPVFRGKIYATRNAGSGKALITKLYPKV